MFSQLISEKFSCDAVTVGGTAMAMWVTWVACVVASSSWLGSKADVMASREPVPLLKLPSQHHGEDTAACRARIDVVAFERRQWV